MAAKRFLLWATALFLCAPAIAIAQTTGEPPAEQPKDSEPADDTEDGPASTDAPMGTPETVEAETKSEQAQPPAVEKKIIVEKEVQVMKVSSGRTRIGSAWNRSQGERDGKNYLWLLDIGGYLRAGYTGIQNDPTGTFGAHDGFVLGNARLTLDGKMKSMGFRLQIDGAVDRNDDANDPNAEVVTRLKDANIYWQPVKPVRLTVGQFKPPHDAEEQASTTEILFVERSVMSRGVKNVEGRNVEGLSMSREVGVKLGTEHWHFGKEDGQLEGAGVSYGLALTNGQSANSALNDNDKPAYYARAEFHWADLVTVGGGYFTNDRTIGVRPDTIEESHSGWTGDLTFTGYGVTFIGSAMGRSISRPGLDGVDPETTAFGYQAQVAYRESFFGFQPTFRFASFDPVERSDDTDALTYMTFGLNYRPDYPVALLLNYTLASETDGFEVPNNRFDGVLQVTW